MKRMSNVISRQNQAIKFVAVAIILILALTVLILPTTAQAVEVLKNTIRGLSVTDTDFSSTDSSGCISTGVFFVAVSDNVFHQPPGPPNSSSEALFFISQFNVCTFTILIDALCDASLADSDFQVSNKLDSATLNAVVGCSDFVSNSFFNVSVNLIWTATGNPAQENDHSHFRSPFTIVNSYFQGEFRPAQAQGSVSNGTTNFTPDPSLFANIMSVKSGGVGIFK